MRGGAFWRVSSVQTATGAGHGFAWFRQALAGVAQPTQTVQPTSLATVTAGGCCPTSSDPRVLTASATAGTSGIDTAARAVVAAGQTGEQAVELVAVAGAESGYRAGADNPASSAHGWWQLLTRTHHVTDAQAEDPKFAARFAVQLRDASPHGLAGPWAETYGAGRHLPYMDAARAAVAGLRGRCRPLLPPAPRARPSIRAPQDRARATCAERHPPTRREDRRRQRRVPLRPAWFEARRAHRLLTVGDPPSTALPRRARLSRARRGRWRPGVDPLAVARLLGRPGRMRVGVGVG